MKTFHGKSIDLTTSTKILSLPINKDIEVTSIHSDGHDDYNDHDDWDDRDDHDDYDNQDNHDDHDDCDDLIIVMTIMTIEVKEKGLDTPHQQLIHLY